MNSIHWPSVLVTIAVLGSLEFGCFMTWLMIRLARREQGPEQFENVGSDERYVTKIYDPPFYDIHVFK